MCDAHDRLPSSGPDAIAFPDIVVEFTRGEPASSGPGTTRAVDVHGLSEFGIQVKSANVLFVSISVHDTVTVVIDAQLEPLRRTRS